MRKFASGVAVLLAISASTALAQAPQYFPYPVPNIPQAPNACGPGYFSSNCYGTVYGPNYYLYPPYPPFNGFRPSYQRPCPPQNPGFPTHPFARSPRDFFMLD